MRKGYNHKCRDNMNRDKQFLHKVWMWRLLKKLLLITKEKKKTIFDTWLWGLCPDFISVAAVCCWPLYQMDVKKCIPQWLYLWRNLYAFVLIASNKVLMALLSSPNTLLVGLLFFSFFMLMIRSLLAMIMLVFRPSRLIDLSPSPISNERLMASSLFSWHWGHLFYFWYSSLSRNMSSMSFDGLDSWIVN